MKKFIGYFSAYLSSTSTNLTESSMDAKLRVNLALGVGLVKTIGGENNLF